MLLVLLRSIGGELVEVSTKVVGYFTSLEKKMKKKKKKKKKKKM